MLFRLSVLLLLATVAYAETPAGCANRPAPSNQLSVIGDDTPEKKGLKQRLKDQFGSGCTNILGACWGQDQKPEEQKPEEPKQGTSSNDGERPTLHKRDDAQQPASSTSSQSSPPQQPTDPLAFPEDQSRRAEIKANGGESATHEGPNSSSSRATYNPPPSDDVIEMHPYDPHKADKDVEVGDYYYKQQNYRAAVSRYREALDFRPRDPKTTFKLADALEKGNQLDDAALIYSEYAREFPDGPQIAQAKQALQRLGPRVAAQSDRLKKIEVNNDIQAGEYLLAQKNYPEAVNRFCDVAANAPDNSRAFFRLAQSQQETGEFASAYANYQAYLRLAPNGPFAYDAQREIRRLGPQVQTKATSPSSDTRP